VRHASHTTGRLGQSGAAAGGLWTKDLRGRLCAADLWTASRVVVVVLIGVIHRGKRRIAIREIVCA